MAVPLYKLPPCFGAELGSPNTCHITSLRLDREHIKVCAHITSVHLGREHINTCAHRGCHVGTWKGRTRGKAKVKSPGLGSASPLGPGNFQVT